MKKIMFFTVVLGLCIVFSGCSKEKVNWNPPMKGLLWGMSMDEVKEALDCTNTSIEEQDKIIVMSFDEKCKTIYGIEMEMVLYFYKDMGLYTFDGTCGESDIPVLKANLEKKYKGYLSSQQPGYGTKWNSERVIDREDYEELMNRLSDRFGSLPAYDGMKKGFQYSPLVSVELFESGGRIGNLIVSGNTQIAVDSLLSD